MIPCSHSQPGRTGQIAQTIYFKIVDSLPGRVESFSVWTFSWFNLCYHFNLIPFWDFMDLYANLSPSSPSNVNTSACRCSCQSTGEPPPPKSANLGEWNHSPIKSTMTLCQILEGFPLYIYICVFWTYTIRLGQGRWTSNDICFLISFFDVYKYS